VVDIPDLVARLEESGYTGWITIERTGAADPITEIGDAVQYLQNIYAD
jgi:sugar phosphate isomerase/epimerase